MAILVKIKYDPLNMNDHCSRCVCVCVVQTEMDRKREKKYHNEMWQQVSTNFSVKFLPDSRMHTQIFSIDDAATAAALCYF